MSLGWLEGELPKRLDGWTYPVHDGFSLRGRALLWTEAKRVAS
jgi:hypothetical protein